MKTFIKFLVLTVLIGLFLNLSAQQTTLKWIFPGQSRTETFDWQYGRYNYPVRSPFKLALQVDGDYLTGSAALRELQKPVWGEDGDKIFSDILPNLTPAVSQYIYIAAFPWFSFADTIPTTEAPHRGYEGKTASGRIYQMLDLASVPAWDMLKIICWRPFNNSGEKVFKVDNPLFPVIEFQRAHEMSVYKQILENTFIQMGTYTFPSFKMSKECQWFLKMEGETDFTEIQVDKNYWLTTPTGGWKPILLPLKTSDLKDWNSYVSNSILLYGNVRLKRILGM